MKSISIALVTVLSLASIAGCKKKGAEGGDATCEQAVAKVMELSKSMFDKMPADKQATWKGKMSAMVLASCKEDKWPAESIQCSVAATDEKSLDACMDKMGPAKDKFAKRMEAMGGDMMKDMAPPAPPAAPPAAPAAADPAAPAAGSGSAAAPAAAGDKPAAAAPAAAGDKPADDKK